MNQNTAENMAISLAEGGIVRLFHTSKMGSIGKGLRVHPFERVELHHYAIPPCKEPLRERLEGAREIGFLRIVLPIGMGIVIKLQLEFPMSIGLMVCSP